ncbi:uncharacterized [Tachysurus ichikawai]
MEGHATFYWSFIPYSIRGDLNTCAVLCPSGRPCSLYGHCYAGKALGLEKVAQGSSITRCQKKGQPPGECPPFSPPTALTLSSQCLVCRQNERRCQASETVAGDIAVEAASQRPLSEERDCPRQKEPASQECPPAGAPIPPDIALQMGQSPR